MLAALRWLIGFIIAAAVLMFAVLNRQDVSLTYSFLHDPLEVPLYFIGLVLLGAGYILGALTIWMNDSKIRRERRKQRREIKELNKELENHKAAEQPSLEKYSQNERAVALPHH